VLSTLDNQTSDLFNTTVQVLAFTEFTVLTCAQVSIPASFIFSVLENCLFITQFHISSCVRTIAQVCQFTVVTGTDVIYQALLTNSVILSQAFIVLTCAQVSTQANLVFSELEYCLYIGQSQIIS
jgi:hypothetical protein